MHTLVLQVRTPVRVGRRCRVETNTENSTVWMVNNTWVRMGGMVARLLVKMKTAVLAPMLLGCREKA